MPGVEFSDARNDRPDLNPAVLNAAVLNPAEMNPAEMNPAVLERLRSLGYID